MTQQRGAGYLCTWPGCKYRGFTTFDLEERKKQLRNRSDRFCPKSAHAPSQGQGTIWGPQRGASPTHRHWRTLHPGS